MQVSRKIKIFIILPAIIFLLLSREATAQYRISGLVGLSYQNYETKIGNQKTTEQYFTQTYQAGTSNFLWDPRFLIFNAGAGYTVFSDDRGDSKALNYNVSTTFFPGMKVSWQLQGSKTTNRNESTPNIPGYDTSTTTYGGTLQLNLSRSGARKNNNYVNNNNNNNWGRFRMPMPDITLSRMHTEYEALNTLLEKRDDTKASLSFRNNSSVQISIDGGLEEYENTKDKSSYDTRTLNLSSTIQVSRDSELKLDGRLNDRTTHNISGYETNSMASDYSAILNFREKDGISHYYRYSINQQDTATIENTAQRAEAQVNYRFDQNLSFRGGVIYTIADYSSKTATLQDVKGRIESGGVTTGATYNKIYHPSFLGPFGFNTSYDLDAGFSKVTGENMAQVEGRGWYYANRAGLGLRSVGWKEETASLDYTYLSKRDASPVNNDILQQNFQLSVSTKRIPRTSLNASGNYSMQDSRSDTTEVFYPIRSTNSKKRTATYSINAVHTLNPFLQASAGATRGNSTSRTESVYTLSTLPSVVQSDDTLFYGTLNFHYLFTRNVLFRAAFREEYRTTSATGDFRNHQANANLNYRIRSIFLDLEYKWRQEVADYALRTTQQYYFAKLSRPF